MGRSALLLACGVMVSCSDPAAPDPLGPRRTAWIPSASAVLAEANVTLSGYADHSVVRDSAAWRAMWNRALQADHPVPPLPTVNFDTSMVIMVVVPIASRVRVDSVVVYDLGSRAYVSSCQIPSPLQVEVIPAEFVASPRSVSLEFDTRHVPKCW